MKSSCLNEQADKIPKQKIENQVADWHRQSRFWKEI